MLCLFQCGASLVFTAGFAQTAPAPAAEKTIEVNRAAKVVLVEGDVAIISSAKKRSNPALGDYLVEGDSIVTGKDGELHLDMEDGGYISVRPNTKMRIVKYSAKGETSDTGVFGLLEGSFRSVTGWIGKFNGKNYTVRTPTATVGIRGTDHEPYVIPTGSTEGEPGTYDKVNEGGSFIQTASGRADIGANQSGFVSHDKAAKPRLLKDIPAHFRAGRNERLFAGKHAEVQARIEKRREQRRGEIREKLQKGKADAEARRKQRLDALKEKRAQKVEEKAEAKAEKKQDGTRAEQRKARLEEKQEQKKLHDAGERVRRRGD